METRLEIAELAERLRWFIRLRWLAVAGVVLATLASKYLLGIDVESVPLLLIAALIAGYNMAFWLGTGTAQRWTRDNRLVKLAANIQIAFDLVALAAVIHFTGGIANPLYLYYVFHIIVASILLSALETFLHVGLAIGALGAMAVAELEGWIPHVPVRGVLDGIEFHDVSYVSAVLVAFSSALAIAAVLGTSIVDRLRDREAEIIRLKESLEQRTVEVEAAYRQLRQTEMLKSQYMRKASHELRAPLATVETLLTVALDGFLGELPEKCRDLLERASARTKELQTLVNDLLILARARELAPQIQLERIDVKREIEAVVSQFSPEAARKHVEVLSHVSEGLGNLYGDPEAIRHLLSNLVSNAVRYTSAGGKVLVCGEIDGASLHIIVSDTGIGIEPRSLNRVFDEFYRTKQAREMVRDGSGLGLAIVKAIVDAHKGYIQVDSEPGKGTTFSVVLPLRRIASVNGHESKLLSLANVPE